MAARTALRILIAVALIATGAQMAAAQETVIHGFSGSITGASDGSTPYDGLISDAKGNLSAQPPPVAPALP